MAINRIFVRKKNTFNVQAQNKKNEIMNVLGINVDDLIRYIRYDIEGLNEEDFKASLGSVFSEPPCDDVFFEDIEIQKDYKVFAVEFLPGQYDQRADSASQCVQLLTQKARPLIRCAEVYAIKGVTDEELIKIKNFMINPVESREASFEKPESLVSVQNVPSDVAILEGFINKSDSEIQDFYNENSFAMSVQDLIFVRDYFKKEHRDPSITEIKVIDTYWSDHCRHTTYATEITNVTINSSNPKLNEAYALYEQLFNEFNASRKDKYKCLMDIATIAVKKLKKEGKLDNLDESDEINACSINVKVDVNGVDEDYLIMFKNETHNHPTEIEPFGGAATCLGGAIRDPLSGRTYVYQAMRITGASDPTVDILTTLKGKLPQRVISKTATAGFSSYGNQIGLATGFVKELYHENYVAKRLETGYVVGAAPKDNVMRSKPQKGDIVILLGGATGRDGCGGATGSSKAHTTKSVEVCGAEVQKGNPLTERKLQRLFRNSDATKLIKKCNDFGAGGVCVAIGELSDGLDIDLDAVPKKYDGLDGTELAISESQERMAVVVDKEDVDKFVELAKEENLVATVVAVVTDTDRMKMNWRGKTIVDIARSFLDTNGVKQQIEAVINDTKSTYFTSLEKAVEKEISFDNYAQAVVELFKDKNVAIQKGMVENFDSTIGANSVLMPYGGKNQLTESISMVAKVPVLNGVTDTATISAFGFNPYLMSDNVFVGSIHSILTSVSKVVATGGGVDTIRLTFQEFFKRLNSDSERWGEPLSAMLGALYAQINLGLGAIGGKDSMSGTFESIDVPPTLISFAIGIEKASNVITNVLSKAGKTLYKLPIKRDAYFVPDFKYTLELYEKIHGEILNKNIDFATVVEAGGSIGAIINSSMSNGIGVKFENLGRELFSRTYGDIIISTNDISAFDGFDVVKIGETTDCEYYELMDERISISEVIKSSLSKFNGVYSTTSHNSAKAEDVNFTAKTIYQSKNKVAKPRVFIPVFPGTNCEYDSAKRFELAGAESDIFVIKNQSVQDIEDSVKEIAKRIDNSQIIMFPGGFSGGDEPDGSGKFIATTFRNSFVKDAVMNLLNNRDGLALGICNGFQAMIKLGLVPYGEISDITENSPTLTFNNITRHVSQIANIRVASNLSPWFAKVNVGDVYAVPVSHGEGRFVANDDVLKKLIENGQIATQYVDNNGKATALSPFNPNGSVCAIEGITSVDGRILGKMGHSERIQDNLYKNIDANFDMKIFESGVEYFK